jgi:hypothetical protein
VILRVILTPFTMHAAALGRAVDLGMKGMDTIAGVCREFYQHRRTIKQIARDLHVARR